MEEEDEEEEEEEEVVVVVVVVVLRSIYIHCSSPLASSSSASIRAEAADGDGL